MVLLAAFLGWMFDGLEMGIHPLVAHPALEEFYDVALTTNSNLATEITKADYVGQWNGRITAFFLIGAALGGFVFGWLGDKIGRVKAMTLSILFYSGFTGLCYFADSPLTMGLLRFLAALGMGGEWSLGVALVMEAWPSRNRPLLAGLIGAAANLGFMLIAVLVYLFPLFHGSWRLILIAGATPALLTFIIRIFVPESEKWQEAVKQEADVNPLTEVFSSRWRFRTFLAIGLAGVALIGTWGTVQNIPTWVSTTTQNEFKKAAVPAGVDFKAVQLTDEQKVIVTQARAKTQAISALGAIIGCLFGPLLGAWFSRRAAYALLCVASFGCCMWLFRNFSGVDEMLFQVAVFVVGMTTAAFYGWLPLYLPELFATRIRATGQGIAFNFGRILAAVGAIYTGTLVKQYGWDGMGATLTWVYALGLVLIFFAPETKGKPMQ
jgi:MFS transporter, SHS family, sialic acid transporter